MSQVDSTSRISITAYRGVTGTLFGLAILACAARTYIRIRILKQFSTEDILLLFAVVCLCVITALSYDAVQGIYNSLALILHGTEDATLFNVLDGIPKLSKEENAGETTIVWLVIFPVKLAFLFFFRRLINRLRNLNIWWWCVVAFTIPAGLTCIAVSWLTCPYTTVEGVLSCSGASTDYRVIRDVSITTVMDVITDILVVSFPVALLWKVRINAYQKFGLAVSLCLSLVMAVIAIVRISGIKLAGGAVDIVWIAFWQQQECSIAVIMVSVSAFRTLFIANASNSPSPKSPGSPNLWKKRILRDRSDSIYNGNQGNDLQKIPRATLTGMRTMIQRAGLSTVSTSERDHEALVPPLNQSRGQGTQRDSGEEEIEIGQFDRGNIV